ncbi:MAG: hypothetical protein HYX53_14065 [Chloroflexi bacterium]|nr:hypothetical protein [Chloroflexota bacterium]
MAEIVVIPPNANTFKIQDVLGSNYSAWRGAVNIVMPYFRQNDAPANRRILADELSILSDPEEELLSLITHRMNLPLSWAHISQQTVERERARRLTEAGRQSAAVSGDLASYTTLLQEELSQSEERIKRQQEELESKDADIAFWESNAQETDAKLRGERFEVSRLKALLQSAPIGASNGLLPGTREAVFRALNQQPTLEDALTIVAELFADRVTVLESAWNSASESQSFRYSSRALELLWKLATDYWEALDAGKGDVVARGAFGQAYAALESETVNGNPGAIKRRTFAYRGEHLVMTKHLKIGIKDSVAETWRCHFEWLASESRIVIGHCGRHLDFS